MNCRTLRAWALTPLLTAAVALLVTGRCRAADEDEVRAAFASFQAAVKAKDGDKIWDLLDPTSQAAVDKKAKAFKTRYEKAGDDEKKKLETQLGLTADEMARLTGKLFLKSTGYYGKYHEVPDGTIDKITVDGDKATVNYTEEDKDKEKLGLARVDGKWKVSAPPP